jgi:hypothetical protein
MFRVTYHLVGLHLSMLVRSIKLLSAKVKRARKPPGLLFATVEAINCSYANYDNHHTNNDR